MTKDNSGVAGMSVSGDPNSPPSTPNDFAPRVQIVNRDHPHFEEYGRFTRKIIRMKFGAQNEMAEVRLEHCRHGCDTCFVSKGDVRQAGER